MLSLGRAAVGVLRTEARTLSARMANSRLEILLDTKREAKLKGMEGNRIKRKESKREQKRKQGECREGEN